MGEYALIIRHSPVEGRVSQFAPGTGVVHSSSVKTLSASVVVGDRGGEGANLLGAS